MISLLLAASPVLARSSNPKGLAPKFNLSHLMDSFQVKANQQGELFEACPEGSME